MSSAKPGAALRSLRKRNRWTLAEVAQRTGIAASTLSRIERDQISPTYDMLLRLSGGLAIDVGQLLSTVPAVAEASPDHPGRRSVNRSVDGDVVPMRNHTLRYLSTDLLNKQMTPILSEYRARSLAEFGPLMRHDGEEFLYILQGELELHTDCYAPLVLKAGDSAYFDSRMGHGYVARGAEPCRALSMCTVPQHPDDATQASDTVGQAGATPPQPAPAKAASGERKKRVAHKKPRVRRAG